MAAVLSIGARKYKNDVTVDCCIDGRLDRRILFRNQEIFITPWFDIRSQDIGRQYCRCYYRG